MLFWIGWLIWIPLTLVTFGTKWFPLLASSRHESYSSIAPSFNLFTTLLIFCCVAWPMVCWAFIDNETWSKDNFRLESWTRKAKK
jgi:hypothetical protein